jgi:hypothetical protein
MFTVKQIQKIKDLEKYLSHSIVNEDWNKFVPALLKIINGWCEHEFIKAGEIYRYPTGDLLQCKKCGYLTIKEKGE